jgi:hypothetical protein
MSFLPAAFGCACAATVINDLLASWDGIKMVQED